MGPAVLHAACRRAVEIGDRIRRSLRDGRRCEYIQHSLACSLSASLSSVSPPICVCSAILPSFSSFFLSPARLISPVEPDVTLKGILLLQPYRNTCRPTCWARWTPPCLCRYPTFPHASRRTISSPRLSFQQPDPRGCLLQLRLDKPPGFA